MTFFPRDPNNHLFFKEFRTLSSSTEISRISIFILARVGSYDKDNNPTEHIVGYRDYERSYKDYATREEAEDDGIRYVLENCI